MKITAEFNSSEEILEFLGLFKGDTPIVIPGVEFPQFNITEPKKEMIEKVKADSKEINKKMKEEIQADDPKEKTVVTDDKKKDEEPKITKEYVRAKFTELIKAGKQKEAKEITAKYGAKKLPDVKEEDYAAIVKDVEALL